MTADTAKLIDWARNGSAHTEEELIDLLAAALEAVVAERDERLTKDESRTLAFKITDLEAEIRQLREAMRRIVARTPGLEPTAAERDMRSIARAALAGSGDE